MMLLLMLSVDKSVFVQILFILYGCAGRVERSCLGGEGVENVVVTLREIQCLIHQTLSLGKVKSCAKFWLSSPHGSGDKGFIAPLACPDQVCTVFWSRILASP